MMAAPTPTRTPTLPRPARCGLDEFAQRAHTIAEMIKARTARMSPDRHGCADRRRRQVSLSDCCSHRPPKPPEGWGAP